MFWIVLGQKYSVFTRLNGIKSYRLNFRDTRETSGVVVVVFKTTVYRRSGVAGRVGRRMQPPKHTAFALCRLRARNTFSLRAPPQLFRATLSRTIRADDAVSLFYVRFMQRVVGIKNAFFFFYWKRIKERKKKNRLHHRRVMFARRRIFEEEEGGRRWRKRAQRLPGRSTSLNSCAPGVSWCRAIFTMHSSLFWRFWFWILFVFLCYRHDTA